MDKIIIGSKVCCVENDPMDEYYCIPKKNRWLIGDKFVVKDIQKYPYGTFLYDGKGHNLNIKRAKLIT